MFRRLVKRLTKKNRGACDVTLASACCDLTISAETRGDARIPRPCSLSLCDVVRSPDDSSPDFRVSCVSFDSSGKPEVPCRCPSHVTPPFVETAAVKFGLEDCVKSGANVCERCRGVHCMNTSMRDGHANATTTLMACVQSRTDSRNYFRRTSIAVPSALVHTLNGSEASGMNTYQSIHTFCSNEENPNPRVCPFKKSDVEDVYQNATGEEGCLEIKRPCTSNETYLVPAPVNAACVPRNDVHASCVNTYESLHTLCTECSSTPNATETEGESYAIICDDSHLVARQSSSGINTYESISRLLQLPSTRLQLSPVTKAVSADLYDVYSEEGVLCDTTHRVPYKINDARSFSCQQARLVRRDAVTRRQMRRSAGNSALQRQEREGMCDREQPADDQANKVRASVTQSRQYVAALRLLQIETDFVAEMNELQHFDQALGGVLTADQRSTIFQNLNKLVRVSEFCVQRLSDALDSLAHPAPPAPAPRTDHHHTNRLDASPSHAPRHDSGAGAVRGSVGGVYASCVNVACEAHAAYARGLYAALRLCELLMDSSAHFADVMQEEQYSRITHLLTRPTSHLRFVAKALRCVEAATPSDHRDSDITFDVTADITDDVIERMSSAAPSFGSSQSASDSSASLIGRGSKTSSHTTKMSLLSRRRHSKSRLLSSASASMITHVEQI